MNNFKTALYIAAIQIANVPVYAQNGNVETKHDFTYNALGQIATDKTIASNGDEVTIYYRYLNDVMNAGCTPSTSGYNSSHIGYKTNIDNNSISNPVEVYTVVNHKGTAEVVSADRYDFYSTGSPRVWHHYKLNGKVPFLSFVPFSISSACGISADTRYALEETFTYDNYGNTTQVDINNKKSVSSIYGYKSAYKIAEIDNATLQEIAYTSFEPAAYNTTWTYNPNGQVSLAAPAQAKTGTSCYNMSSGNITKAGLPIQKYIVSYWRKNNGLGSVTVSGAISSKSITPVINPDGWQYEEHVVNNVTSITISGSNCYIDELRMYPYDASMQTYTYSPLIGITSFNDARNKTSYYVYDDLGRLYLEKNEEYNIVKKYEYKLQQAD